MSDHSLPKRIMSEKLGNAGQRRPGGKEKELADCIAENRRGCLASRGTGVTPH